MRLAIEFNVPSATPDILDHANRKGDFLFLSGTNPWILLALHGSFRAAPQSLHTPQLYPAPTHGKDAVRSMIIVSFSH